MTGLAQLAPARPALRRAPTQARVALLGLGRVGSAVAGLLAGPAGAAGLDARISGVLVRNAAPRPHARSLRLYEDPAAILDGRPDVLVEVLGGAEPARTIVLDALRRGIPVVTANKTLVAYHGDELSEAALESGVSVRCEAAVLAGVPFLGALSRRPLAAAFDRITGILNGTSNFVLSRVDAGLPAFEALADAQRRGLAEPDPSKDLDSTDAAEKLSVLLRYLGRLDVAPSAIPRAGVAGVEPDDLTRARGLGGCIKPIAFAGWSHGELACFAGPAFLPSGDPLAALDGVLNGIRIERDGSDPVHLTGPGAGPDATARTIVDDVVETLESPGPGPRLNSLPRPRIAPFGTRAWYVSLHAAELPDPTETADLLSAHDVWVERWGAVTTRSARRARALITFPCPAARLGTALDALAAASGCSTTSWPVVEGHRG